MVRHRKCRSMGVKVPDFTSHMPLLHSSRTFSLARPIVERHVETSARLPKLVRASAAPHHPIHLSVTSQIERDITSTFKPYVSLTWHMVGVLRTIGLRLVCFRVRPCEEYWTLCAAIKA